MAFDSPYSYIIKSSCIFCVIPIKHKMIPNNSACDRNKFGTRLDTKCCGCATSCDIECDGNESIGR